MRFGLWAVVVALVIAQVVTGMATPEASPDSDERKPYLSHGARFVTTIPSDWVPDRTLAHDYAGESGFIASGSLFSSWGMPDPYRTLDEACDEIAERYGGEPRAVMVAEMPACRVEPASAGNDAPVGVVITHPQPRGDQEFVVVVANRGSLDVILNSLSFDVSSVTPWVYFDVALDLISVRSLQRDLIDWERIRSEAHLAMAATSPEGDFGAAQMLLRAVMQDIRSVGGDGHNHFLSADEARAVRAGVTSPSQATLPTVMPNEPAPGLVKVIVPRFASTDEAGRRYVESLWLHQEAAIDETTCGIVVDLSSNSGGNMYPMLQGLGPLLGEGPLLGFIDAAGNELQVTMNDRYQLAENGITNTVYTPERPVPDLGERSLAIAVVIGPMTASAGEATAIGLLAADFPVRLFGETTSGFATSGDGFPLMDGAMVLLSGHWTTTVDGQTFPQGIAPDVEVDGWNLPGVIEEWIRETTGC